MNYRHAFHAGNFADVVKHALLVRILAYLTQKPAALRVIDTHAGAGLYDLAGEAAMRTGEWQDGIGRLLSAANDAPRDATAAALSLLAPYLAIVRDAWPSYPGSPLIAAKLLRRQDRLLCCELHAPTAATLADTLGRNGKIIALDGYTGINAFVPPPERRGVVLLDPPFEATDEFARLATALIAAWRKWPTGVYIAWYPLKDFSAAATLVTALQAADVARCLKLECQVAAPRRDGRLVANGLIVVNPPFGFDEEARTLLTYLTNCLAVDETAGFRIDWLSAAGRSRACPEKVE